MKHDYLEHKEEYWEVGDQAAEYAKLLYPNLILVEKGKSEDLAGRDAYEDGVRVQIKGDRKLIKTNNICHQTKYYDPYKDDWLPLPADADYFLFVSWDNSKILGIKIEKKILELVEEDMIERQIKPGSRGYIIGLDELPEGSYEIKKTT